MQPTRIDGPVFYTADLHLGHKNILAYCHRIAFMSASEILDYVGWVRGGEKRTERPYISDKSIKEMDDRLIANINVTVPEWAHLFIIGDFMMAQDQIRAIAYRNRIKCRNVRLVIGSHDSPCIWNAFDQYDKKMTIKVGDDVVALDHEAHYSWDRSFHRSYHLYGHSHGRIEQELDQVMPGRLSMDVGIDNAFAIFGAYRPFSHQEIIKHIKGKETYVANDKRKVD
jgi:calcineurin-like phosphoesterase family protein